MAGGVEWSNAYIGSRCRRGPGSRLSAVGGAVAQSAAEAGGGGEPGDELHVSARSAPSGDFGGECTAEEEGLAFDCIEVTAYDEPRGDRADGSVQILECVLDMLAGRSGHVRY